MAMDGPPASFAKELGRRTEQPDKRKEEEKPKYVWVREPLFRGQDQSLEPTKQYRGNGRWVKKRVK